MDLKDVKKGLRVRIVPGYLERQKQKGRTPPLCDGMEGTICDVDGFGNAVGVTWDGLTDGHDCLGTCKDGTGWGVLVSELEKVEDFTYDSPFTLDATNPEKFRRVVTPPTNTDSLRPEFNGSNFVLPRKRPHKGPEKGGMIADPRFDPYHSMRGSIRRNIRKAASHV